MNYPISRQIVIGAALIVGAPLASAAGYSFSSSSSGYSSTSRTTTTPLTTRSPIRSTTDPIDTLTTPDLHSQSGSVTYSTGGDVKLGDNDDSGDEDSDSDDDDNATPPSSGHTIVSFEAETTGLSQARTLTFGQVFKKGDVPNGHSVVAEVGDRMIPTQVDPKASWDDGSVRHAVITVRLPSTPSAGGTTVSLVAADNDTASSRAISLGDILSSGFSGAMNIKAQGRRYQADARSLLRDAMQSGGCSDWGKHCKQWLSGPLASEWIVGGPASNGRDDASNLAIYFHVRAYSDGNGHVIRARVDTIVENDWAYPDATHNLHYNARLRVGDQSYSVNGLTHYRQARWHRVLWWGGDPDLYARLDTDYLQASKAISNYADVTPSSGFLSSRPTRFAPMDRGNQTADMSQTGAQATIGPLPRWSSTYAVSGHYRAFRWMLANDSAVGSYGFHYRDQDTGRPLTITDHPYVTLANYRWASHGGPRLEGDLLPSCESDCHTPYTFSISHQPSIGYLPYLVTGDYYYLEEMQFAASYDELWSNESYRQHAKGILRKAHGQIRSQAWALRTITDAAFATPDDDPMKSYFTGLVRNIFDDYNDYYVGTGVNPLHTLVGGEAIRYPYDNQDRVGVAPWQTDFFTWAVGHAVEQDMAGASSFLNWLAKFQIERMTDWIGQPASGFCWLQASAYKLRVRDSRHSPIYDNMAEVYRSSFSDLAGTVCDSSNMILRWNNHDEARHRRHVMAGFPSSATGYPANFQIGLAMAVDSDHDDGQKAWRLFDSRDEKPDYDNYANFAVVPRSVSSND